MTSSLTDLPTLEIRARALRQIGPLAIAIVFIVAGGAMAVACEAVFERVVGGLLALFFLLLAPPVALKAIRARGRVLSLSLKGLQDFRASTSVVPWEGVTALTEDGNSGVRLLRVYLTESAWDSMAMSGWVRFMARRRETPYFVVTDQTTGLSFDELKALIEWYHGRVIGLIPAGTPAPIPVERFQTAAQPAIA